jgi:hypothetical protein
MERTVREKIVVLVLTDLLLELGTMIYTLNNSSCSSELLYLHPVETPRSYPG